MLLGQISWSKLASKKKRKATSTAFWVLQTETQSPEALVICPEAIQPRERHAQLTCLVHQKPQWQEQHAQRVKYSTLLISKLAWSWTAKQQLERALPTLAGHKQGPRGLKAGSVP